MKPSEADTVSDVAYRIIQYLEQHPQATDSFRGICTWWLRQTESPLPEAAVARALDQLVLEGCVDCHQAPGGERLYRRRMH
ncbi:hypothetical protein [Saccharospirillum alexandrii]|uniref:hypothetical protein n=1 Tax=Saccharospirillum alexandrii TaxID=2448477 RepID=UPI000FD6FC10|nr:hypothetical protein [Saccharospirillum alexandrii]